MYGDGWEISSLLNGKKSCLGRHPSTFSETGERISLKNQAKEAPEKLQIHEKVARKASTPVKLKIKRLEARASGDTKKEGNKRKTTQLSMKSFIESVKVNTNLKSKEAGSGLGAQKMRMKATSSGPSSTPPKKVGRELLGKRKGYNKGFGPLDKWLGSRES